MKNIAENHVVRFKNISKKKGALFANFIVRSLRGGVAIASSISVDLSELELHAGDSLEKIIDDCAKKAIAEFKRSEFHLEDLSADLGVAQLG